MPDESKGLVFDIKRDCSEDGPGIRTTVFFKGCPLSCVWCQNPEGISAKPAISFSSERCDPTACGGYACIEVCPLKLLALNPENTKIRIDHNACNRCDQCFDACTPGALEPVGSWWTVEKLVDKVLVDKKYFQSTGGGITVSGGEPTLQMDFLHRFLTALKQANINIGLETAGMFLLSRFQKLILPYLDFVYFDLKLIHPAESRRFTGKSNEQIIENFLYLNKKETVPIIPRIPLVPGITTTEKNLSGISYFLRRHGIRACALIPYNPLWLGKADKFGADIKYSNGEFMSQGEEENCIRLF
ncbi:MAG: glycyl-radical enzyme activating protein [bacterium]|nr:glycyl-radical enzyme activating protein [bacterium]